MSKLSSFVKLISKEQSLLGSKMSEFFQYFNNVCVIFIKTIKMKDNVKGYTYV